MTHICLPKITQYPGRTQSARPDSATSSSEVCPRANRSRRASREENKQLINRAPSARLTLTTPDPHSESSPQTLFLMRTTLTEHKWIILRKRRGSGGCHSRRRSAGSGYRQYGECAPSVCGASDACG